jgi:hypothetical protein
MIKNVHWSSCKVLVIKVPVINVPVIKVPVILVRF